MHIPGMVHSVHSDISGFTSSQRSTKVHLHSSSFDINMLPLIGYIIFCQAHLFYLCSNLTR